MPTLYDNFSQVRQYIDENNTSYVTKTELANASYVTSTALENASYATNADLSTYLLTPAIYGSSPGPYKLYSAGLSANTQYKHIYPNNYSYANFASLDSNAWMSKNTVKNYVEGRIADIESTYATQSYVADYVAEHGGGGGSTVIDENIIPKENNTYTLGDNSYLYAATYTSRVKVGNNSQIYNDGGGITFSVNSNNGIRIGGSSIYPKTSKGYNNGSSTNLWGATYQRYSYLGTGVRLYSEGSDSSNDLAIDFGGVSYYYMNTNRFAPNGAVNDNKLSLGTSDRRWLNIYTSNLYLNDNNVLYNKTQYQVNLKLNGGDKYVFRTNHLSPASDGGSDLGQSDLHWNNAYINNAYISNYSNFIWTGTSAEYEALSDYTTYQLYLVKDE